MYCVISDLVDFHLEAEDLGPRPVGALGQLGFLRHGALPKDRNK
jgi:hypothetical protein